MASKLPPPSPPRLTGDQDKDFTALRDWYNQFYQNSVIEHRLLDPNRQFVPDEFDADNLFDPTDSSIANAQKTANEAYTNGATKAAEALDTAQTGIDALTASLATEVTARTAGDATNATAITAEATARADADTTLTTNLAAETAARVITDGNVTALQGKVPQYWGVSQTVSGASTAFVFNFTSLAGTLSAIVTPRSKTGTPPDGAFIVDNIVLTATTAAVTLRAAPGVGNSVTFDITIFVTF